VKYEIHTINRRKTRQIRDPMIKHLRLVRGANRLGHDECGVVERVDGPLVEGRFVGGWGDEWLEYRFLLKSDRLLLLKKRWGREEEEMD
jgi:hypothetical protein